MGYLREYQVIGRRKVSEHETHPKVFRMKLFAPSKIHAKSRFWYFMGKLQKIKPSSGEILSVVEIYEKSPHVVKNFGVLCRYNSRTGTHNVYKEFRDLSRNGAVEQLYADMASKHRARYRSIQIIDVKTVKPKQVTRPNVIQFLPTKLRFPLPHRVIRAGLAQYKKKYAYANRPTHQG
eukprot:TRINITY_DN337_c1_g2_i1.p1 TRINITY_DN337_c1_g2~~TRINITY_DN337_c1_g2_i1.p1  ORF type:complete len:186 (+),score=20.30 TRINITY_DN337_c1_g2_i1:26-559(+)